jgi:hypothetical protein
MNGLWLTLVTLTLVMVLGIWMALAWEVMRMKRKLRNQWVNDLSVNLRIRWLEGEIKATNASVSKMGNLCVEMSTSMQQLLGMIVNPGEKPIVNKEEKPQ